MNELHGYAKSDLLEGVLHFSSSFLNSWTVHAPGNKFNKRITFGGFLVFKLTHKCEWKLYNIGGKCLARGRDGVMDTLVGATRADNFIREGRRLRFGCLCFIGKQEEISTEILRILFM